MWRKLFPELPEQKLGVPLGKEGGGVDARQMWQLLSLPSPVLRVLGED